MKDPKRLTPKEVLHLLGDPGLFTRIVFLLCITNNFLTSFSHLAMVIWGATPPHRCRLPDGVAPNNLSIPEKDGKLDSCSVYVNYSYSSGETRPCPDGWVYTLQDWESTVVNQVGELVVHRKSLCMKFHAVIFKIRLDL